MAEQIESGNCFLYLKCGTPQITIAAKSYGAGSSRDWAAKGPALLGVRAAIAESFERILRSNLIGLGVLPLQFDDDHNPSDAILDGSETYDITGLSAGLAPGVALTLVVHRGGRNVLEVPLFPRAETDAEIASLINGGVLQQTIRALWRSSEANRH